MRAVSFCARRAKGGRLVTAKQQRFCEEYLIDLNATRAAIRAGYSPRSARTDGPRLLENADVRARIDEEMALRSRRTGVSADRVVRELARVAFVRASDVIDAKTGGLRDDASKDDLAAVAGMRVKDGGEFTEREVRMCDKVRALELLGKHLGMFTDNVQIEGAVPVIVDDTACVEGGEML